MLGRCFSIRSVRERLNLILLRFLQYQKKKIKSSGTEEEQSELEDLLQQAADIARECSYTPPPSTTRQLAERDGIKKRASGNSVARPPAKRRVDNREEDALAAYAEFTAVDGVEPGPQRYAEATYALIEARCDRDTAIETAASNLNRAASNLNRTASGSR
ncbi:hypothetical protein MRX96_054732 [Rhipicephalus microplus]